MELTIPLILLYYVIGVFLICRDGNFVDAARFLSRHKPALAFWMCFGYIVLWPLVLIWFAYVEVREVLG